MNRRGFLKLLGAAIAAPFVAKAKIIPTAETDPDLEAKLAQWPGWEFWGDPIIHDTDDIEEVIDEIVDREEWGPTIWIQDEVFPDGMVGWAMNEANPGETVTVFMGGSGDLYNFRASIPVTKGNVVTLETIGMKGADDG